MSAVIPNLKDVKYNYKLGEFFKLGGIFRLEHDDSRTITDDDTKKYKVKYDTYNSIGHHYIFLYFPAIDAFIIKVVEQTDNTVIFEPVDFNIDTIRGEDDKMQVKDAFEKFFANLHLNISVCNIDIDPNEIISDDKIKVKFIALIETKYYDISLFVADPSVNIKNDSLIKISDYYITLYNLKDLDKIHNKSEVLNEILEYIFKPIINQI